MYILETACKDASFAATMLFVKKLIDIVFIAAPILLILILTIDFSKAIIANNEERIKQIKNTAIKRVLFAVLLFFIPLIVDISFGLLDNGKGNAISCYNKVDNAYVDKLEAKANAEKKQQEQKETKEIEARKKKQEQEAKKREKNAKEAAKKMLGGEAKIYFLGTGTSDCIILESKGHYGIVDTSMPSRAGTVMNSLKKIGVKKIDFILITHAHYDHMGATDDILNKYKVDKFYIKKDGAKHGQYADTYEGMIRRASNKGAKVVDVKTAPAFQMGDFNFNFYNRKYEYKSSDMTYFENGNSTAILGTIGKIKVYITGDIGNYTGGSRNEITAAREVGHVDIYKAAHHGFPVRNNYEEAIKHLTPVYTVITNALNSGYDRTVDRIKNKKLNPNYKGHYVTGNRTVTLQIKQDGTYKFSQ